MFKDILKNIYRDLTRSQNTSKESLLEKMVQDSLDVSYNNYCDNLKKNYDYLLSRSNIKVLKTIKKEKLKEEKNKEKEEL